MGRKWKLIMDCRQSSCFFSPFCVILDNLYINCTKPEPNAGHGGFSASDTYWSLLCSFIKLLLSHSPEAAHSLALSEKPIVTSTVPHAWEAAVAAKHNRALFLSFTHAKGKKKKKKSGAAVFHVVNTGRLRVWSCVSWS